MIEHPKAIAFTRGEQIKNDWRQIRRSWLVQLAKDRSFPEDRLALLSQEDRAFVQRCRLERVA